MSTSTHRVFRSIQTQYDKKNSLIIRVLVQTSQPGTVFVRYGTAQMGYFQSPTSSVTSTEHVVTLLRLRPDTLYQYKVYLSCSSSPLVISSRRYNFQTRSLPNNIRDSFRMDLKGQFSSSAGLIILCINGVTVTRNFFQGYLAIDQEGEIVWFYQDLKTPVAGDFYQLKNLNMLITRGQSLGLPVSDAQINQAAQMRIIHADGRVIHTQPLVCRLFPKNMDKPGKLVAKFGWTHAAWQSQADPNTIFHLGLQVRNVEGKSTLQMGETIQKWIPSENTDQIITSAFQLEDPLTYRGPFSDDSAGVPVDCDGSEPGIPNVQDWTHGNAISQLDDKSPWVISQRNTSSILVLSSSGKKLLYKFGLAQPSDLTISRNAIFVGQHDAHFLCLKPRPRMLMFDDATDTKRSARALELELDLKTRKVRKVWEFNPPSPIFCNDGGSARRLTNGHTIVDFGASNLQVKHVFETRTKSNRYIADFTIQSSDTNNTWLLYRAIPIQSLAGETPCSTL